MFFSVYPDMIINVTSGITDLDKSPVLFVEYDWSGLSARLHPALTALFFSSNVKTISRLQLTILTMIEVRNYMYNSYRQLLLFLF